jgi:hypothetical protein
VRSLPLIRNESPDMWHTPVPDSHPAARLLTASAVRERCAAIMSAAERGDTRHLAWRPDRLAAAAAYVADTIRLRYPNLDVPYHSRWRHFEAGGIDRWGPIAANLRDDSTERARTRIDLAITSVLMDAGAGPAWRYADGQTGSTLARSEGLGVASLRLFASGAFSARADAPCRADARALAALETSTLAKGFQVTPDNPLVGLDGRAALLRRLGAVASATPAVFGAPARLGHLYDYLSSNAQDGSISAGFLLATLLRALGPIWPSRLALDGVPLGDCWRHPAARAADPADPTNGYVPFHKLTQWLAYSLLEPLEDAGLAVTGLDELTGLPEYRNGGLMLDTGVLAPIEADFLLRSHNAADEAIVEWRALTVIALDRIATSVREILRVTGEAFPLARVLEGGTWAAGRRIAAERREGGTPPVSVASDGTVF